ncbi:MAG: hypothetical protein R2716_03265 [Microthrixaceae bacterium]
MFAPFLAEFDLEEFTLPSPRPLVVDGRAVGAEMADVAASGHLPALGGGEGSAPEPTSS